MSGFSVPNPDPVWLTPYTPALFTEFRAAFGYDLTDHLPELFLHKDGEKLSPVKWQYMELLQRLFIRNYLQPLQSWCREHNMQLTGHLLHEDSLTAQAAMAGSLMRCYGYMDLPGIDILAENGDLAVVPKQIQSAARQNRAEEYPQRDVRRDRLADEFPEPQGGRRLAGTVWGKPALPSSGVVQHAGRGQAGLSREHPWPVGVV